MKAMKAILIILAFAVLAGAGIYYLLSNLDDFVLGVIEDTGSELTGTAVTLDSVEIDLPGGRATLRGLVIDNPEGYDSDYAFSLATVRVDLDPGSLVGDVVLLEEVTVDGARLIAEQKGTANNLSDILRNVNAASSDAEKQPEGEPVNKRLALSRFAFTDTQATLRIQGYGEESLRIPDVVRQGIGDPGSGLAPAELAKRLLKAVLEEARSAVSDAIADRARDAATDAAKKKLMDKLDMSDKGMDSAGDALKSLFNKD